MRPALRRARRRGAELLGRVLWVGGLRPDPARAVFLLSWMRSGSSLLSHLVLASGRYTGIGETHTRYRSRASLSEAWLVAAVLGRRRTPRLFDKLLHDHLTRGMPEEVWAEARFVFLTRELGASYRSILRMQAGGEMEELDPLAYLERRTATLRSDFDRVAPERRLVVDYREVTSPEGTGLERLADFLGHPVPTSYDPLPTTGRSAVGDPSERIRSGEILAPRRDDEPLPPEVRAALDRLEARVRDRFGSRTP